MSSSTPAVLPIFNPPGNLGDLTPQNREVWSRKYISQWMDDEIAGNEQGPCGTQRTPLSQFFNPTKTPYDQSQTPTRVEWIGFPHRVQLAYPGQQDLQWRMADATRLVQDEYLEWSSARDDQGNIVSCVFTCEGPEYWQCIGDYQSPRVSSNNTYPGVLELYKTLNPDFASQMGYGDLFLTNQSTGATVYNPMNYWNMSSQSGTIAHLVHPSNTLSAEIDIAAQATVMRVDAKGNPIVTSTPLIECSQYGQLNRNSDPQIGISINSLCGQKKTVSIADPVALYIQSFDTSNLKLQLEDGSQADLPDGTITYPRGAPPFGLRIAIKIPASFSKKSDGSSYTISDIFDTQHETNISYASQFALYIMMGVSAVAAPVQAVAAAKQCPCPTAEKKTAEAAVYMPTQLLPRAVRFGLCKGAARDKGTARTR